MDNETQSQKQSGARRTAELLGLSLLFIFIAGVAYMLHAVMTPRPPVARNIELGDQKSNPGTFFERTASWGPCALPDQNACHDELTLSQDGTLDISSVKGPAHEKISAKNLEKIKAHIRTSNLLHKSCEAPEVLDYVARYKITLDGVTRDIDFPGCENDLKIIDDILNM